MAHKPEDSFPFENAKHLTLENFKSHGRKLDEQKNLLHLDGKTVTAKDLLELPLLSPKLAVFSGCVADVTTISGSKVSTSVYYKRLVLSRVQVYIKQSLESRK